MAKLYVLYYYHVTKNERAKLKTFKSKDAAVKVRNDSREIAWTTRYEIIEVDTETLETNFI